MASSNNAQSSAHVLRAAVRCSDVRANHATSEVLDVHDVHAALRLVPLHHIKHRTQLYGGVLRGITDALERARSADERHGASILEVQLEHGLAKRHSQIGAQILPASGFTATDPLISPIDIARPRRAI